jgi:hypothetical protein
MLYHLGYQKEKKYAIDCPIPKCAGVLYASNQKYFQIPKKKNKGIMRARRGLLFGLAQLPPYDKLQAGRPIPIRVVRSQPAQKERKMKPNL